MISNEKYPDYTGDSQRIVAYKLHFASLWIFNGKLMTSSEADARIVIDQLLRQAQWNPADKSQVRTEVTVQDLEGC